jgi:hypothetical protein
MIKPRGATIIIKKKKGAATQGRGEVVMLAAAVAAVVPARSGAGCSMRLRLHGTGSTTLQGTPSGNKEKKKGMCTGPLAKLLVVLGKRGRVSLSVTIDSIITGLLSLLELGLLKRTAAAGITNNTSFPQFRLFCWCICL